MSRANFFTIVACITLALSLLSSACSQPEPDHPPVEPGQERVKVDDIVQTDLPSIPWFSETLAAPHSDLQGKVTYGNKRDERLLEAAQNGTCEVVHTEKEYPNETQRVLHADVNEYMGDESREPFILLEATVDCPDHLVESQ